VNAQYIFKHIRDIYLRMLNAKHAYRHGEHMFSYLGYLRYGTVQITKPFQLFLSFLLKFKCILNFILSLFRRRLSKTATSGFTKVPVYYLPDIVFLFIPGIGPDPKEVITEPDSDHKWEIRNFGP